jgi:hypothetical protein
MIVVLLTTLSQAPLNGGFIQLNGEVLAEKKAGDYRAVLRDMKRFGMDLVVIQFLGAATDNASPTRHGSFMRSSRWRTPHR